VVGLNLVGSGGAFPRIVPTYINMCTAQLMFSICSRTIYSPFANQVSRTTTTQFLRTMADAFDSTNGFYDGTHSGGDMGLQRASSQLSAEEHDPAVRPRTTRGHVREAAWE
jgi:hypothetical protein